MYISRWKNTVAHYIATCPIIYLYLDTDRRPGLRTWTSLWEQEVLFLSGKPAEGGGVSLGRVRSGEEVRGGYKREAESGG